jgi:hypothetical protein
VVAYVEDHRSCRASQPLMLWRWMRAMYCRKSVGDAIFGYEMSDGHKRSLEEGLESTTTSDARTPYR